MFPTLEDVSVWLDRCFNDFDFAMKMLDVMDKSLHSIYEGPECKSMDSLGLNQAVLSSMMSTLLVRTTTERLRHSINHALSNLFAIQQEEDEQRRKEWEEKYGEGDNDEYNCI